MVHAVQVADVNCAAVDLSAQCAQTRAHFAAGTQSDDRNSAATRALCEWLLYALETKRVISVPVCHLADDTESLIKAVSETFGDSFLVRSDGEILQIDHK
jgi:hypothetical protein